MARTLWGTSFLLILVALTQAAPVAPPPQAGQQFPPGYMDPRPILEAARKAIGNDALRCVTISGSGYNGAVGQQKEAAKQVDWPRPDSLANYTRTMNWDNWTMKEEFDRKPGLTPALWKYGIGWIDGTPIQKNPHQIFMLNGKYGWHMDGANGAPTAVPPDIAEVWPVELVLNPHGFLKAAQLPGANPKAVWRWELGEMGRDGPEVQPEITRILAINWGKYRIDATVNKENMLQRLHTWVPDPVLGDMNYEHEFTNASYIDVGNGIKFPTGWHSHQGWDDNTNSQSITAGHNAFGGTMKDVKPNVCPDAVAVPDSVRNATFPVRVETTKLADGVFLLGGATHNSVAIEFNNYITIFEAPLNEDRSLAVIEEVRKLIPNKPIRFVINTNQHFDHAGGLRTYAHIGATIITQFRNFDFYNHDFLTYAPRTLKPDMVSLWPPTEFAEGYNYETVRENYVLSDGTRNLNIYYVNPLQKVEGMLMAYLPKERLLLEADLVDTNEALPATLSRDQQSFANAVRLLKLDPARIVPVHGKPIPWSDFSKIAGNKSN
ncbi:MAG TPA: MBL fold metallo-hydrolase [Terriglobia bacterium]|nr:MBL fold metallo-hydrolase [Terriglobia bacterium]